MSTPPGWFPNPANDTEEVYWDGDRWTGDVRAIYGAARTEPSSGPPDGAGEAGGLARGDGGPVGGAPMGRRRFSRAFWLIVAGIALVLIVGGVTTAVVMNNAHTQQVAAQKAAADRKAESERVAAEKLASDNAERSERTQTVKQVEDSVKKLAEEDISKDILVGPVLGVACNPISGSTDDLTDTTTTFDCFVANKNNDDGTQSGYFFNATVNWSSGQYTYGLGKSGS